MVSSKENKMKKFLLISIAIIICVVAYGVKVVNQAVRLDELVVANWAQVNNQFQRRFDLIPNIVETVKGYATHEEDTLTKVIEMRAAASKMVVNVNDVASMKKYMAAQNELGGVLSRLMAVSEAYPDLKANQNFLALQSELEGTENRLAVARRDYIQSVKEYNIMLRVFPSSMIIRTFTDLEPKANFEAFPEAQTAPKVQF